MLDPVLVEKAETVVAALAAAKLHLVTAESCTGGAVATAITSIPGASDVFEHGFVTYSNTAKETQLGVEVTALQNHGAVSDIVARQMAEGALAAVAGGDISVAITGIAGPGGGSPEKPIGLVFIATARRSGDTRIERFQFQEADRQGIRQAAALQALGMVVDAAHSHRPL